MPSIVSSGVSPGVVVRSLTNHLNIGNTASATSDGRAQDIGGAVDIGVVDANAYAFVAIGALHDQEGGVRSATRSDRPLVSHGGDASSSG
jgi:hypothetical protein